MHKHTLQTQTMHTHTLLILLLFMYVIMWSSFKFSTTCLLLFLENNIDASGFFSLLLTVSDWKCTCIFMTNSTSLMFHVIFQQRMNQWSGENIWTTKVCPVTLHYAPALESCIVCTAEISVLLSCVLFFHSYTQVHTFCYSSVFFAFLLSLYIIFSANNTFVRHTLKQLY